MERRTGLWLALGIWGAAAGCQHTANGLPPSNPQPPPVVPVAPAAVTKVADNKPDAAKKNLKPDTYVRFADFRANEAAAPTAQPAIRDQLRDDARRAYQYALSLDANCVQAHCGLARLYTAMQDYPRAAASYDKALQLAPRDAAVWYELGMCQNRARDFNAAADALGHAVQLEADNQAYVNALAVVLARLGRYDESLQCFARVNSEAKAHYCLGCTLRRLDQPELSMRHLQIAVGMDPKLQSARTALADMTGSPAGNNAAVQPAGYTAPPVQP